MLPPPHISVTYHAYTGIGWRRDGVRVKRRDETTRHFFFLCTSNFVYDETVSFSIFFQLLYFLLFCSCQLSFFHIPKLVSFSFSFSHILALVISSAFICIICIISSAPPQHTEHPATVTHSHASSDLTVNLNHQNYNAHRDFVITVFSI